MEKKVLQKCIKLTNIHPHSSITPVLTLTPAMPRLLMRFCCRLGMQTDIYHWTVCIVNPHALFLACVIHSFGGGGTHAIVFFFLHLCSCGQDLILSASDNVSVGVGDFPFYFPLKKKNERTCKTKQPAVQVAFHHSC